MLGASNRWGDLCGRMGQPTRVGVETGSQRLRQIKRTEVFSVQPPTMGLMLVRNCAEALLVLLEGQRPQGAADLASATKLRANQS